MTEYKKIFSNNPNCRKTTFISKGFVNRTLAKLREYVTNTVVKIIKVESNGKFSLMTDTTTDISTRNICSVVLRYTNDKREICQTTVGFVHVKNSTGQGIYQEIKSILEKIDLPIDGRSI